MKLTDIEALCNAAPEPSVFYFRHAADPYEDPMYRFLCASRTLMPKLLEFVKVAKWWVENRQLQESPLGKALAALEADE